jgi:hypothetical protein
MKQIQRKIIKILENNNISNDVIAEINELFPKPKEKKRKKRRKKGDPLTIPQLRDKADKLFSNYIKDRDNYTCFTCGKVCNSDEKKKYFHAGHYVPRGNYNIRYDERNVNCQCFQCNIHLSGNTLIYRERLIKAYNQHTVELLEKTPKKYTGNKRWLLETIIRKYKEYK